MTISAPTGVFDILPTVTSPSELWRSSSLWHTVEKVAHSIAHDYGFHEIRTPIFERVELFQRSVGDVTDIVSKEMYVFEDRGGRKLALRPEGTASVMRALIEHQLFQPVHDLRLFYIGPMFRYERPQAGRFRQHHQFGMEVVGVSSYEQDAEMIEALYSFYKRLHIPQLSVYVNSLGGKEARARFKDALISYLIPHKARLSEESQIRLEKNPLRILDSKDPGDKEIVLQAPSILDFLDPDDKAHFEGVLKTLDVLKIPYSVEPRLVRGLDYYQRTVFEVTTGALGAQNTIGAGGRYDGLLKQMGGQDLPSIGCATGLERVIQTMLALQKDEKSQDPMAFKERVELLLIPMGDMERISCVKLAQELRESGVRTLVDMSGKKLKQMMTQASNARVRAVMIVGETELKDGVARIKDLDSGNEVAVHFSNTGEVIAKLPSRH